MKPRPQISLASPPASLESLQTLLEFAEKGGVAATAEALEIPQPTVSRRLMIFQRPDVRGESILARQGRQLVLTEKGRAALPAIRDLVRQYGQLDQFLKGTEPARQTIRIGLGSFGAEHYLPRVLAELRRRDICCDLQAEIARGQERIVSVAEGRFDLAIVTHDPRQIQTIVSGSKNRRAKIQPEDLAAHTFCVLAAVGTPFAKELQKTPANRPAPLSVLAAGEFVGLDRHSGIRLQLESEFQKIGVRLRFIPQATVGGWSASREFARHGVGVAIIPLAALAPGDEQQFTIRRLPDRFHVTDYLIRRQGEESEAETVLLRILRQSVQQLVREVRERWKGLAEPR